VIDLSGNLIEVRATGGDTLLGGVDFDDHILVWALTRFQTAEGIDLAGSRAAIQRLRDACEAAKISLSTATRARVHVPFITTRDDSPVDLELELTRGQLEALTDDLVDRTLETTRRIVGEAGDRPVDTILLVGGQSRMPAVRSRILSVFGQAPAQGVHPDEAVALGAALLASALVASSAATPEASPRLEGTGAEGAHPLRNASPAEGAAPTAPSPNPTAADPSPPPAAVPSPDRAADPSPLPAPPSVAPITLVDVLPMAVGTAGADGRLQPVFPRGTSLPSRARRTLTTSVDGQDSVVVGIYQGDAERAADNELLGGFVFSGFPRGPQGSVRIEARFRLDVEGVLAVAGVDLATARAVSCARADALRAPAPAGGSAREGGPPPGASAGDHAHAVQDTSEAERVFEGAPPRIEAQPGQETGFTPWARLKGWLGGGGRTG
jgi:molecular chaperone DnaK (HSP70)